MCNYLTLILNVHRKKTMNQRLIICDLVICSPYRKKVLPTPPHTEENLFLLLGTIFWKLYSYNKKGWQNYVKCYFTSWERLSIEKLNRKLAAKNSSFQVQIRDVHVVYRQLKWFLIRSQSHENDISLFAKKWCFKKNISNFVSGEVWTCKKLYKYLIFQIVQNFWLIITIWHIFSAEASCCHKMKLFRNSIRNAPYIVPDFIELFIAKDLDIRNGKYCSYI